MSRQWETYDPSWLVELAKQQRPELPWLIQALAACINAMRESDLYIRFVDSVNANKPGADWQFDHSLRLRHPEYGELILDILKGQRVGGVEFYDRLD
ncbi:MAG: hypothetical protein GY811_08345 [Myxococcales bacterium]|nr:hypothetical protein [Myxococcales bacterium]